MAAQNLTVESLTNPAQNAANRAGLFASAFSMSLALSPNTGVAAGATVRQLLENVGILQSIDVLVSMTVTNNGTSALVPSVAFPYNLVDRITFTDYNRTERVNLTGTELWMRNCFRGARIHNAADEYQQGGPNDTGYAYPTSATTGAIAAGDSATVEMLFKVPVSMSHLTTMGALLMQGNGAQAYANVTLANSHATGGYDLPFTGDYTITAGSVQIVQRYLQPQNAAQPYPAMDLSTVYELAGNQPTSDNIAVGAPKFINIPNARTVHGVYLTFANGAYNYGSDLTSLRIRASGNTYLNTDPLPVWLMHQRNLLGGDFLPGRYFADYSRTPITTNYVGQFQVELVPSSVGTNPSVNPMFESTYMVGTQLPGMG
jgi:P3 major capsid protein.